MALSMELSHGTPSTATHTIPRFRMVGSQTRGSTHVCTHDFVSFSVSISHLFVASVDPTYSVWPNKTAYLKDPAGWGYLLYPPKQPQHVPIQRTGKGSAWSPVESIRWVMTGAGIQDAEYLYALQKKTSLSAKGRALLSQAREMATSFPKKWNPVSGHSSERTVAQIDANSDAGNPTTRLARQTRLAVGNGVMMATPWTQGRRRTAAPW